MWQLQYMSCHVCTVTLALNQFNQYMRCINIPKIKCLLSLSDSENQIHILMNPTALFYHLFTGLLVKHRIDF